MSHLTDTDPDEVIVIDVSVVDEPGGGFQSPLTGTCGTLEGQVLSQARTKPSHSFQPQIVETRDGWYQDEDCFDPGQIAPTAAP